MPKFLFVVTCLVLGLLSQGATAQNTRADRANRLALALGIQDQLRNMQESQVAAADLQMQQVLDQFRRAGIKERYLEALTPTFNRAAERMARSWDPAVASQIYSEGLLDVLSDEELEELVTYYSTEKGKREYRVLTESEKRMQEYVNARASAVLEEELSKLMAEAKKIVEASRQK
jgi:hypothetical protein